MTKLLRGLSNKLARIDIEGNNQNRNPQSMGQRNPNYFRIPFNPQILNRDRRKEYLPIQPHVIPNDADHIIYFPPYEEFIKPHEGINWLNDDNQIIHIT